MNFKKSLVNPKMTATMDSGFLGIFTGPMYSGKTTRLVHNLSRASDVGSKVLLINHSTDRERDGQIFRSSGVVTTHNSSHQKLSGEIDQVYASKLSGICVDDYDVIGIDECQFFDGLTPNGESEFVETIRTWVINLKKEVYLAGLNGSWKLQNFGHLSQLFCLAGKIKMCKAVCHFCRTSDRKLIVDAAYTSKIGGNMSKDVEVEVGSSDKYLPTCLSCHRDHFKN